jgi:NMD protein affecting ribosome stability and mRNA decay
MRFCPGCGKKIKQGTFCENCEPLPNIKIKDIKLRICSDCNKFHHKNKWKKYDDLKKTIKNVVKEILIKQINDFEIKINLPELKKNPGINVDFEIKITKGKNVFILPGELNVTSCNICSKKTGDYFEGTLQLRNPNKDILKFIDNYFTNQNKKVVIQKKTKHKNGIDLKVTSKKHLHELGKKLHYTFGGILKISPTLHGFDHQSSKHVYRLNVYFKAHDFKKEDVIKIDNKIIKVNKLGKIIYGINIKNNKSVSIDIKDKEYIILKKYKTSVSKIHPNVEVLHPETYQSIRIDNKTDVKLGEKVNVVLDDGNFYII